MFKILLVDDSALMRQFVARALVMTGFELEIHHAGDGRAAITLSQALLPDLIITDLNMPELNGEELLDNLSGDKALCEIPVIVLTADGERCRTGELFRHGKVLACLQKPVRPEDIRERIAGLFPAETLPDLLIDDPGLSAAWGI